ncbi:MAG: peptidase BlaR1 [Thermoleophilia bacterium]|nr:peptidase BlaR1 [Thermoleophilia bacterium]
MTRLDQGSRAFRRALMIALGLLALVGGIAISLVPLGVFEHLRGMMTQLCVTAAHITSDVASLSLVLLAGSAIVVATISVAASVALQRQAMRDWSPVSGASRRRVARVCRASGIHAPTVVFGHDEAIACSRGVTSPSIWISDAAVRALDDDELAAVLAHEDHHCDRRDPAKRQMLEVLSRTLFAFPVVGEATSAFLRSAEFAADDAAARVTSSRTTASALLQFASAPGVPVAVQFGSSTTIGERVQRLIGTTAERPVYARRSQLISAVIAALAVLCLLTVALLPAM